MKKQFKIRPRLMMLIMLALSGTACVSNLPNSNFNKQQAAKARVDLAVGYLNQQDFVQAKLNLDKALNYAPDYYLVYSALAYFHQKQGNVEPAKQAYLTALKLDNKQGDVHNNYGTFLCGQGNFDEAYKQFNQALTSPNYYQQADTYENMALCALSQNNLTLYQQSIEQLEKIASERAIRLKSAKP